MSSQTKKERRSAGNGFRPHSAEELENAAESVTHFAKDASHKAGVAVGQVTHTSASLMQTYLLNPLRKAAFYLRDLFQNNTSARYFALTFLVFSIIPLSIFSIFLIGSLGGMVMVAMTGVTLIESVMLFPAAFILGICLLGAAGLTVTIFGGFVTAWFSVAALKVFSTKVNNLFGGVTATVKTDLDALDQGAYKGTTY